MSVAGLSLETAIRRTCTDQWLSLKGFRMVRGQMVYMVLMYLLARLVSGIDP